MILGCRKIEVVMALENFSSLLELLIFETATQGST